MSQEKDTTRLEAFSDGVFAIAITLLVLELKLPKESAGASAGGESSAAWLCSALASQWPSYLSFVLSFFSILIMWVHHHALFRLVRRSDTALLYANGLLLMLVTFVPFPTAVLADHLAGPAGRVAAAFYSGTFVLISLSFLILLGSALRKTVRVEHASAALMRRLRRSYFLGPPMYLVATAAAPLSRWLSLGICTGLWILWALTTRQIRQDS